MSSKADVFARHNGSPPATVAVMDGEAMVTDAVSAPASEAPRLATQIIPAPDMVDYELKPAPHEVLQNAVAALDVARFTARQARSAVLASREDFNVALSAWTASGPAPQDQMALKKEWIASNQAERARKAAAGQLRRPATVGEMARALAGGGQNVKRGGGASYRRGAHSKAEAMEINANRLRAATLAAKLPSQR
jgi:hypothetical protein